jgi:nicotinamidase-related amidase
LGEGYAGCYFLINMLGVYSLTRGAQVADIVSELLPLGGELVVISGPDKFIGTELESILKKEKIGKVIVTGMAAHGAALHATAGGCFQGV